MLVYDVLEGGNTNLVDIRQCQGETEALWEIKQLKANPFDASAMAIELLLSEWGEPTGWQAKTEPQAAARAANSQLSGHVVSKPSGPADTETDKKPGKKQRVLTDAARACGRAYRRAVTADDKRTRKQFCQDWTAENGHKYKSEAGKSPSWQTIERALRDHPEAWKPATDTANKPADTEV